MRRTFADANHSPRPVVPTPALDQALWCAVALGYGSALLLLWHVLQVGL